jgi:hypothetical protein
MSGDKFYSYIYLKDEDILLFKLTVENVDKDIATAVYDGYTGETGLPDFSDFIMDATAVKEISDPAIGILMKAMAIMKTAKGYLVLVMTEDFLQKIMMRHPEMFNVMAIFHSVEDARAFIKRSHA